MYDFYPEWGPARHRDEQPAPERRPRYWAAMPGTMTAATAVAMAGTVTGTVTRDGDAERPDDN